MLLASATMTFLLGKGYHEAFRTGVLTIKGQTSRRDMEPIGYWAGMAIGIFAFLVAASFTALAAFLVGVDLFGASN
jgi:hypothetical protein